MQTSEENLTLENIKDGASMERFNIAIQEIMKNIQDPNTEPTATREIALKMQFKPSQDRDIVAISFQVIPKPAPLAPIVTRAAVGLDIRGEGFAREIFPHKQQNLPLAEVKPFKKEANND